MWNIGFGVCNTTKKYWPKLFRLDSFYKLKVKKLKAKIRDWRWVGGMIYLEIEGCKTDITGISLAWKHL